jgi:hypothetical protein
MAQPRNVVWRVMDGEAFIVDVGTGAYFSLNGVGTEIWMLLQEMRSESEIAQTLSAKYGIDAATAANDVAELAAELRDARVWGTD